MGRPPAGPERRQQILDATIQSLRAYGVSGTTLERISKQSGMSRGHIRHFLGNREDLLVAVTEHFFATLTDQLPKESAHPNSFTSFEAMLDYLFGEVFTRSVEDNRLVDGLLEVARTSEKVSRAMANAYGVLEARIAATLAREFPDAEASAIDEAAFGVLCLALGNVFLREIDPSLPRSSMALRKCELIVAPLGPRAGNGGSAPTPPPPPSSETPSSTPSARDEAVDSLAATLEPFPLDPASVTSGSPDTQWAHLGVMEQTAYGMWEMSEGSARDTEADEVFVVVAGSGTITRDDGTVVHLAPGTVVRLYAGEHTEWTVTKPIRKVWFAPA
ncbi:cupin domain-containing protein [Streptomyces sp. NPDC056390]|uniref:cupin domain-containing protein n=1 Tax=Streptomyces sp. NPDC056390 TaxID=3345806 RepID=UPI0035D580F0